MKKTRHSKNKNFTILAISLLLSAGLSWFSNIRHKATVQEVTTNNDIQLSLKPDKLTMRTGEEKVISITIDTKNNSVASSIIELNFDPKLLTVTQLIKGSFFTTRIVPSEVSEGRVAIAYGVSANPAEGKIGSGDIMSIKFKALADGEGAVDFSENTDIVPPENGDTTSASVVAIPASFQIGDNLPQDDLTVPSLSPTPSPSVDPTPSPSPVLVEPTPTPSPSSTPKPTIRPKITSTPIPLPSPSPENIRTYVPLTNTAFDQERTSPISETSEVDYSVISSEPIATSPSLLNRLKMLIERIFSK